MLVHRAVGDRLTCVFVDHGLLREGEAEQVVATMDGRFHLPLVHVDASDRFLDLLPGVARDKDDPARFIVDRNVARLYPLGVFHMLGYRRIRDSAHQLTVERQPE
jgi:GMP synthase (glutamine-hydrolysing)